jgi:hypothetical protein
LRFSTKIEVHDDEYFTKYEDSEHKIHADTKVDSRVYLFTNKPRFKWNHSNYSDFEKYYFGTSCFQKEGLKHYIALNIKKASFIPCIA